LFWRSFGLSALDNVKVTNAIAYAVLTLDWTLTHILHLQLAYGSDQCQMPCGISGQSSFHLKIPLCILSVIEIPTYFFDAASQEHSGDGQQHIVKLPTKAVVPNLFAERSQIQIYNFVREPR